MPVRWEPTVGETPVSYRGLAPHGNHAHAWRTPGDAPEHAIEFSKVDYPWRMPGDGRPFANINFITTAMNTTNPYFIERKDGLLFAPWGFLTSLGALWVVLVPQNADRKSLNRLVRWFHVAMLAAFLLMIAAVRLAGLSATSFLSVAWLTVVLLYSLCAAHRMSGWQRVPFAQAVQEIVPVGDKGTILLLRQVFVGLILALCVVIFHIYVSFTVAFCILLLVNGALTGMVLYRRASASA